jgi:quercetin dioxygenase-like cupin family protein
VIAAQLPEFVRDAYDDAPFELPEPEALDRALGSLLEDEPPSPEALSRLAAAVSAAPLRYAPFYERLGELFDLSEPEVEAQLAELTEPGAWRPTGLWGIRNHRIAGGPRVRGAETLVVRFEPGTRFPHHDHTGLERVLVLEGGYTNDDGVEYRAGDLHEMDAGTGHSFSVAEDELCIFASVVTGRRFSSWPLRALSRILGR